MKKLRILYVAAFKPMANGAGAQMRSHVAASALLELGDVYFLEVPPTGRQVEPSTLFCSTLHGDTLTAQDPDIWSSYVHLTFLGRLFRRAWITAGSMQIISNAQTENLLLATREAFGEEHFDIVFVFQAHVGAFVLDALPHWLTPKGVSILDWDAAERPGAKAQYLRKTGGKRLVNRLGCLLNDWKLALLERKLLLGFSVTVCASQYDVAYFESKGTAGTVSVIPNCVDLPQSKISASSNGKQPHVLFVGLINYWPNREGLLMFLRDIWPGVRERFSNAILSIVGRGMTPDIMAYHGRDGVRVVGEVDSVESYYATCDVAVAPMTFSVGSSIKILESLAYEKPMVAFEVATCRHFLKDGEHISIAKTPFDFQVRLIHLLSHPEEAMQMGRRGRLEVTRLYGRQRVTESIKTLVLQRLSNS